MFGKVLGKNKCRRCKKVFDKIQGRQVFCCRECYRLWTIEHYVYKRRTNPQPVYKWRCQDCGKEVILNEDPIKSKPIECNYCKNNG